jgi:hypothetical protein
MYRPSSVTVVAILGFVYGGFSLLFSLCGGFGLLFGNYLTSNLAKVSVPGDQQNPFQMLLDFQKSIPGYNEVQIAYLICMPVMGVLLIVACAGLLSLQPWARVVCIVFAAYAILTTVAYDIYQLAVVQPAMEKELADLQGKLGAGAIPFSFSTSFNRTFATMGVVISTGICVGYGLALLIVLNLPGARAAFASGGAIAEGAGRRWVQLEPPDALDEDRGQPPGPDNRFRRADEY